MKFFLPDMRMVMGLLLGTALLVGVAMQAHADEGFRCETGRLVHLGDHMMDVEKKCGEPDYVSQRTEQRKQKVKVRRWVKDQMVDVSEEVVVDVVIDEWSYDMGRSRFVRRVSFENARAISIAKGDYGSR